MTSSLPWLAIPEWLVVRRRAIPTRIWHWIAGLTRAPAALIHRPRLGPVAGTCLWVKVPGICWTSLEWKLAPRFTWALCPAQVRGQIPGPASCGPEVPGFPRPKARRQPGKAVGLGLRLAPRGCSTRRGRLFSARHPAFFSLSPESTGIVRLCTPP